MRKVAPETVRQSQTVSHGLKRFGALGAGLALRRSARDLRGAEVVLASQARPVCPSSLAISTKSAIKSKKIAGWMVAFLPRMILPPHSLPRPEPEPVGGPRGPEVAGLADEGLGDVARLARSSGAPPPLECRLRVGVLHHALTTCRYSDKAFRPASPGPCEQFPLAEDPRRGDYDLVTGKHSENVGKIGSRR
jgi:hypothetical protein